MSDTNSTFGDVTFTTSDTESIMSSDTIDVQYNTMNNITYTVPSHTSTSTITLTPPTYDEDLCVDGDIKVGGKSLKDFMETVSDRLSILTPDPKLLEKYDALKEAYEHYKILEKLCTDDGTVHKKT